MSVPLTLLGLLERRPSHGYDLKRDYDALDLLAPAVRR
jgi:DNA-binding PadR family transcriptional regulator